MKKSYDRPIFFASCKGPGQVYYSLSDSFRTLPRLSILPILFTLAGKRLTARSPRAACALLQALLRVVLVAGFRLRPGPTKGPRPGGSQSAGVSGDELAVGHVQGGGDCSRSRAGARAGDGRIRRGRTPSVSRDRRCGGGRTGGGHPHSAW